MKGTNAALATVAVVLAAVLTAPACGGSGDDDFGGFGTDGGSDSDDSTRPTATPGRSETSTPTPESTPADDTDPDRSSELVGRWIVKNYSPAGGGLTNTVGSEPVFVEMSADGTVDYHTGCNSGSTSYATSGGYHVRESALDQEREGQPLTFGPAFTQTEIGCEGFLGDQDRDLPEALRSTTRFVFREDLLIFLDEFLLVELERAG